MHDLQFSFPVSYNEDKSVKKNPITGRVLHKKKEERERERERERESAHVSEIGEKKSKLRRRGHAHGFSP